MKERLFRFKQFNVRHEISALKVGFDGVLLGAWTDVDGANDVLDVGTGCGVIALMLAQKSEAKILGIDIDSRSIEEASINFSQSPWARNLKAEVVSFGDLVSKGIKFDLIVSNPPFYESGVKSKSNPRLAARHIGDLSPVSIISEGAKILSGNGRISLIAPSEMYDNLMESAERTGLYPIRVLFVRNNISSKPKRVLIELGKKIIGKKVDCMTVHSSSNDYTDDYKNLTKDFYLHF